jgi:hypothetical protein
MENHRMLGTAEAVVPGTEGGPGPVKFPQSQACVVRFPAGAGFTMFFLTGLSSSNRTIAYAAFALIAFAAFGVAAAQPRQLSQFVPSNPSAAGSAPKAESGSIGVAAPSLAKRFFGRVTGKAYG